VGRTRRERWNRDDEPGLPEEGWVTWGPEPIWAVGYTEGGAPYGPTLSEMRASMELGEGDAPWARAKTILRSAMVAAAPPPAKIDVGRVTKIGEGLSRDVFAATVEISPDPDGLSGAYAVLLPGRDRDSGLDERTRREIQILQRLAKHDLPFRIPRVLTTRSDAGRILLVRSFLRGVPLDLRAGRQPSVRPWEIVALLAATIHALDLADFKGLLPGEATRREHAQAALQIFDDLDMPEPEVKDARAWAREHLPPDESSVLLHGDLLGQNILLMPREPYGLIDWEYARRGDPASDLAIVTRGVRRPFQIDRGLKRLLDDYVRLGGCHVEPAHVHLHELCMVATWYRDSLDSKRNEPPDQALARLRGLLKRVGA
jgi:aminoglycoside phosphotransferase (APT) family kinase protein